MNASVNGRRGLTEVGFIGLGEQGAPMACAVAEQGWPLHVWARRPASLHALDGIAHQAHETVASLGMRCDIVCLCVRSDADVHEILVGHDLLGAMRPGRVITVHSTGSPAAAEEFERSASLAGIAVLDAPVSGGAEAARRGSLTVMVGGDPGAFERVRPVLETFGNTVVHVGPAGSGQLAKLMNNAMYAANLQSVADVLELAQRLDLDMEQLTDIFARSSGGSYALEAISRLIAPDDAAHAQALVRKDLEHLVAVLRDRGVHAPELVAAARRGVLGLPAAVWRARGRDPGRRS